MITVSHLTKTFKTPKKTGGFWKHLFSREYKLRNAVSDISFTIESGELVGFIGPNGAGKTTTMKMLAGILHPTSGAINVLGHTPFDKQQIFLKQIAFVMGQKNQMMWELPATDTFRLNKEIYEVSDREYTETLSELTALLADDDIIHQPVKTLSLGQRMRVELIGALIHRPKVLFLDEPTIGLDIFAQAAIIKFIKEYQQRYKPTIMLTSHYMQDVQRLAKRVILIDQGSIAYDGPLTQLINDVSKQKTISIVLDHELDPTTLDLPSQSKMEYQFPLLKITGEKHRIGEMLSHILNQIEYIDLTIENESLEEIIKMKFSSR